MVERCVLIVKVQASVVFNRIQSAERLRSGVHVFLYFSEGENALWSELTKVRHVYAPSFQCSFPFSVLSNVNGHRAFRATDARPGWLYWTIWSSQAHSVVGFLSSNQLASELPQLLTVSFRSIESTACAARLNFAAKIAQPANIWTRGGFHFPLSGRGLLRV